MNIQPKSLVFSKAQDKLENKQPQEKRQIVSSFLKRVENYPRIQAEEIKSLQISVC